MAFLNKEGLEHLWAQILMKLRGKVDKEEGKGLSTNDFTNEEKEKLAALGSSVMANADWDIADEALPGAIKNKPFGYVRTIIVDVENTFSEPAAGANVLVGYFPPSDFVNGQTYDVYLDNELLWQSIEWPFDVAGSTISIYDNQIVIHGKSENETHNIKIMCNIAKKLDPEWLDAPTLPDASNVEVDGFALVVKDGEWVISDIPVADKSDTYSLNNRMDHIDSRVTALEASGGGTGGGGSCNCPTGTIEVPREVVVEWNTAATPTVTVDISALGYTGYKVSDAMLTKEQVLSANWNRMMVVGTNNFEASDAPLASDILVDTDDMLTFQFSTNPTFGFFFAYKAGDIPVSLYGYNLTLSVPETGMYTLYEYGQSLPTGMSGTITYTEIELQEVNFVQSNWNQNDPTAPDYVKNRPFYQGEPTEVTIFDDTFTIEYIIDDETTGSGYWGEAFVEADPDVDLIVGNTYVVTFDGVEYTCVANALEGLIPVIGNLGFLIGGDDTGEPFLIGQDATGAMFGVPTFMMMLIENPDPSVSTTVSYPVTIKGVDDGIHKVPTKYLYQPDWNESNTKSGSYIQNRPFGMVASAGAVMANGTVDCAAQFNDVLCYTCIDEFYIRVGGAYYVEFDGNSYNLTGTEVQDGIYALVYEDDNICLIFANGYVPNATMVISTQGTHNFTVYANEDIVQTIDPKYLPSDIGGGGGSGLPEVTVSNNGQVLKVVNGAWATASLNEYATVAYLNEQIAEAIGSAIGGSY